MGTVSIDELLDKLPVLPLTRRRRARQFVVAAGGAIALAVVAIAARELGIGTRGSSAAGDAIVHVKPQVAGRVVRVHVRGDQAVAAGDALIEIDPEKFATILAHADASVAAARGRLEQSRWRLTIAKAERTIAVASLVAVRDRVENGVDERTAELALVSAEARLAAAEARVQLVQAQIDTAAARVQVAESTAERARQDLAHTQIRAPRAGRVTSASVESGDYVHVGQELLALGPERERSDARLAKAPR